MIDEKLGPFSEALQAHAVALQKFDEQATEAESRISAVERSSDQAVSRIQTLEKQVQSMADHIDDLENRGRRKNIQVVGLPEDVEDSHPTKFFEKWIPDLLGLEMITGRMKIERAHRTLNQGPTSDPDPS